MRSRSSLRRAPARPICAATRSSASQLRRGARAIDRLANSGGSSRNSDAQGIGWTSQTLANHTLIGVQDDGFGLGPTAIDTHHRVLRVQASSRSKICCSSFSAHSWGSSELENGPFNIN